MLLVHEAVAIRDDIILGRKTGENACKLIQGGNHGKGLDLLEQQLKKLGQTETKADKMIKAAKEFEERMSSLNDLCKRMDKLEIKNIELENKVEALTSWKSHMEISQIASDFENDLAIYIYPPHTTVTVGPIFHNLILWLDQNKNTPEGQEANNKWEEVQVKTQIAWTDEHEMVLFKMLKCKMVIAAQENDYEVRFSDEEIGLRAEILKMHEFIKPN